MRNDLFPFLAKAVIDIVDTEPVKQDKTRSFDDIRTLRVIKWDSKFRYRDDDKQPVKYHLFEARKRFDLDSGKPTRTTIPLRCTVQVPTKPSGRWAWVVSCGSE
jgi:hypothetical protein